MWWINKNGYIEGPLPSEQVRRRIYLNMIGSLDRVSQDRQNWMYLRDTELWNPVRTLPKEKPVRQSQQVISGPSSGAYMPPPVPERLRLPEQEQPQRKSRRALIFAVCGACVALAAVAVGVAVWKLVPPKTKPTGFKGVREAVAIIKCREGSGTGFLLDMDGKTYLVSNEHVVRSGGAIEARLLDGTLLSLGEFSVAEDGRDLARFEVSHCDKTPLHLRGDMPNVGDQVFLYGNSLGGDVATESRGFIQGVGPKRIETNAEIVHGNSGSPLLDTNGRVVGIAALMEYTGKEDWSNTNTRYDGAVRRYAVRLNGVTWKVISRKEYEVQVGALAELQTLWGYLVPFLLFDTQKIDDSKLVYNDLNGKDFHMSDTGFDDMMKEVSKAYEKRLKTLAKWVERDRGRKDFIQHLNDDIAREQLTEDKGKKMLSEYDEKTVRSYEKVKDAFRKMILIREEALSHMKTFLEGRTWIAPQLAHGYDDDIRGSVDGNRNAIGYFLELMKQKMKDLNKDIKELEEGDSDDEN